MFFCLIFQSVQYSSLHAMHYLATIYYFYISQGCLLLWLLVTVVFVDEVSARTASCDGIGCFYQCDGVACHYQCQDKGEHGGKCRCIEWLGNTCMKKKCRCYTNGR